MAAVSVIDAAIQNSTLLIISEEEINNIMEIVKFLKDSNLLIKDVSKSTKNDTKYSKGAFLCMLLGILDASFLRIMLAGNSILKAGEGTNKSG